MRIHALVLLVCMVVWIGGLRAAPAANDIWRPLPPPPRCPAFIELALVDVSRSMSKSLDGLKQELVRHIDSAPECTLLIVGTFGATADVVAAEFLSGREPRERLKTSVGKLRAIAPATNFDEAAKLVELLLYQLKAAYGPPARLLLVSVYSDQEPSPGPGKQPFSFAGYLARRLNAQHYEVTDGEKESSPGAVRIGLEQAERILRRLGPQAPPFPARPASWRDTVLRLAQSDYFTLAGCALGLVALLGGGTLALGQRRSKTAVEEEEAEPPSAFLVTETEGLGDGRDPAVHARDKHVPVGVSTPVVFSTDPVRGHYVAPTGEYFPVDGELFRVTPLQGGEVLVEGPEARVNGQPIPNQGLRLTAPDGFRINYGKRTYDIRLIFGQQPAERAGNRMFRAGQPA